MKQIRPYGRSTVQPFDSCAGPDSSGEIDKIQREILPKTSPAEACELSDFFNAKTNHAATIAQWISVIDKIIVKPKYKKNKQGAYPKHVSKEEAKLTDEIMRIRKDLGAACWKVLQEKYGLPGTEKSKWDAKIGATSKNSPKAMEGRWYGVFITFPRTRLNANFLTVIAQQIDAHLYEAARAIAPKTTQSTKTKGLAVQRYEAVARNSLQRADKKHQNKPEIAPEIAYEKEGLSAYQKEVAFIYNALIALDKIQAEIDKARKEGKWKALKEKQEEYSKKLKESGVEKPYHLAVAALRRVSGNIFKTQRYSEAKGENPEAFARHEKVRAFYRKMLKERKIWGKVEHNIPKDVTHLARIIKHHSENSDVNALIRRGKIIHYTASDKADKADKADPADSTAFIVDHFPKPEEIEKSFYWGTDGQIIIKQNEALVRVWRRGIALSARILRDLHNIFFSEQELEQKQGDILSIPGTEEKEREERKNLIERLDEKTERLKDFQQKYDLLFGRDREEALTKEQAVDIYRQLRKALRNLRNSAFHFKGMQPFIKVLKEQKIDRAEELFKQDMGKRSGLLKDQMKAANFGDYFGADLIKKIGKAIEESPPPLLPLPRLKRVLERAENAWNRDSEEQAKEPGKEKDEKALLLPDYSTRTEREGEEGKWRLCQYTASKFLYDTPFKSWLEKPENSGKERISPYIQKAVARATKAARAMNGRDLDDKEKALIHARAEKLDGFDTGKDQSYLEAFFYHLTAETASEMRVQKDYESNGEQAQKQAKYIEDLKCDVIAQAFADYLKEILGEEELARFCKNERSSTDEERIQWVSKPQENDKNISWLAPLYALLRLMPVEEVTSLRHQLQKWFVVTKKNNRQTPVEKELLKGLFTVFDLTMVMHDAQFMGQELYNLTQQAENIDFEEFFEPKEAFEEAFPLHSKNEALGQLPLRGLREVMRFGEKSLLAAFAKDKDFYKITKEEVETWKKQSGKNGQIARAQKEREELHAAWVAQKGKKAKADWKKERPNGGETNLERYKACMKEVSEHQKQTSRIMLQDHVRLHRLLMGVLARLLDFSGLWERDLYFVLLALIYQDREKKGVNAPKIEAYFEQNTEDKQKDGVALLQNGRIIEARRKMMPFAKEIRTHSGLLLGIIERAPFEHNGEIKSAGIEKFRNRFAHFNMLQKQELEKRGGKPNLTEEVNKARALMTYDRKLKNAVSKSIIDLLQRENLILKWEMARKPEKPSHCLANPQIKSEKIYHLGDDKNLEEDLHSKAYVSMVKNIF